MKIKDTELPGNWEYFGFPHNALKGVLVNEDVADFMLPISITDSTGNKSEEFAELSLLGDTPTEGEKSYVDIVALLLLTRAALRRLKSQGSRELLKQADTVLTSLSSLYGKQSVKLK